MTSIPSEPIAGLLQLSTGTRARRHGTGDSQSRALTPADFASRVWSHSKSTVVNSIYPGENFDNLAKYLDRASSKPIIKPGLNGAPSTLFATLYCLEGDGKTGLLQSEDLASETELLPAIKNMTEKSNLLLFLRGHPTPEWINTIGAQFRMDPEFFRNHMDLNLSPGLSNRFSSPSLPSVSSNFITLRVTTIGNRYHLGDSTINNARQKGRKGMEEFLKKLQGFNSDVGTSFVRRFSIHDHEYYSIEQDISLCCSRINDSWTVIAWLDSGKDLDKGIDGPWMTDQSKTQLKNLKKVSLLPVIRHHPKIAFNTHHYARSTDAQTRAREGFQQSRSILNQNYGRDLNKSLMSEDSFFAVHELFSFKAFAEVQFLNLVESVLSREIAVTVTDKRPSVENLLFHKDLLASHARALKENIESIKSRGGPDWSKIKSEDNPDKFALVQEYSNMLLKDYQWLLQRTEELSATCDRGMHDYDVKVARDEAQAANERATDSAKLTKIATVFSFVYVPLSITISFFGMNFSLFGQGNLKLWVYFAVSVPIVLVSCLAMLGFMLHWKWKRALCKVIGLRPGWARRRYVRKDQKTGEV